MKDLIIAIDGYSSCGKSSLAREIAQVLEYAYIDTGAMYRAVTFYALQNGMITKESISEEILIQSLNKIDIHFEYNPISNSNDTILNGQNIEEEIRMPEVADKVSQISSISQVRKKLVELQQNMGKNKRIVMDGRDIATVVFPDADIKIFMTADPVVRAERRLAELKEKGVKTSLEDVLSNLKQRDHMDENRSDSPLRKANGAFVIDNTSLSRKEQFDIAIKHIYNFAHEN
ncbi:MAG: cytidylate kinase [Bacteroidetes bacterium HGW-Bacteroidetes-21]|jgi:cytidylate kinase|nr:MAG: cytidylate kinase [Bacteroidetes bacterium HGW-Bacteroidetes-21]